MSAIEQPWKRSCRKGAPGSARAVAAALAMEERGFAITFVEGRLHVRLRSRITPEDDAAIRRHRDELVALVAYWEAILHHVNLRRTQACPPVPTLRRDLRGRATAPALLCGRVVDGRTSSGAAATALPLGDPIVCSSAVE